MSEPQMGVPRITSHKMRFQGTVELPEPPVAGQEYHVAIFGQVRGQSTDDDDAGGFAMTHKFRVNRLEILKPTGEIIKSKDNKKMSQRLRGAVFGWQTEHGDETEPEDFYHRFMGWLVGNIHRIIAYWLAEREKEE